MQKLLTFSSKNISVCAIFNDQSFKDTATNNIVSFEQLGQDGADKDFGVSSGSSMYARVSVLV